MSWHAIGPAGGDGHAPPHAERTAGDLETWRRLPALVLIEVDQPRLSQLGQHVTKEIGAIARPDQIRFTDTLPKTRSGKIMRRLLREIASGSDIKGDTTTLEDFSVIARLREHEED